MEILSPSLRRVTAGAKERLTEDEVQRVERVFELQEQRQQQQQHQAGGRRLDEAEGGGRGAVKVRGASLKLMFARADRLSTRLQPDARKKGRSSTASKSRSGKVRQPAPYLFARILRLTEVSLSLSQHHSTSRDSSTPRRRGSPPYSPRRPSPSPSPSPPPPHIDRWELEDLIPQQHFPGIDVRIGGGNDYQVRENQGGRMVTMARGTLPRAGPEAFMRIGRFPPHPRHHPLPGAPAVGARPGGWTDPAEGAWDAALGDDYRHGRLQHLANVHGGVPAVRGGRGAGQ